MRKTPRESITLSCTEQDRIGLEAIAERLGFTWGDKPNASALVSAIGRGEVTVIAEPDPELRIKVLQQLPEVQEFLKLAEVAPKKRRK